MTRPEWYADLCASLARHAEKRGQKIVFAGGPRAKCNYDPASDVEGARNVLRKAGSGT